MLASIALVMLAARALCNTTAEGTPRSAVSVNISVSTTTAIPVRTVSTVNLSATPLLASPSATTSTTTLDEEEKIINYGLIFGSLITIAIIASLGILCILVAILFVKVSRGQRNREKQELKKSNGRRVMNISSSLYASVNERGRIRRSIRNSHYTRLPTKNSSNLPPSGTGDRMLAVTMRTYIDNGTLTRNCETDKGDYTSPVFSPAEEEDDLHRQLSYLGIDEIPIDQLNIEDEIGRGQFATVYKARWTFISDYSGSPQAISAHVAVKVMGSDKSEEDRVKFLQEMVIMGQFNDLNIVGIFGVITKGTNLMIICELMDEDLRARLKKMRGRILNQEMPETEKNELPALLLSYCRKIASSFVYLGLKGFIHRDLAARNILVSNEGDCKISDFGLSRNLNDDDYYFSNGGIIPVKWTAPEAILYRKYSTKSDVWSYGILLFEIWSLGYKPYPSMRNQEVITKLETGYRLPPPPGCPKTIYELMIKCTHPQPESRPAFTNILVSLQRPDYQLLKWSPEDIANISESARMLGTPLEEGECLYAELQHSYITRGSTHL